MKTTYSLIIKIFRFNRCSIKDSINIPFSSITFGEVNIDNVGQYSSVLKNSGNKIVVVVGAEETDLGLVLVYFCNYVIIYCLYISQIVY